MSITPEEAEMLVGFPAVFNPWLD